MHVAIHMETDRAHGAITEHEMAHDGMSAPEAFFVSVFAVENRNFNGPTIVIPVGSAQQTLVMAGVCR